MTKDKVLCELIHYLFDDVSNYSFGITIEDINRSKLKRKLIKQELDKQAKSGVKYVHFDKDNYGFEGSIEVVGKSEQGKMHFFVQSGIQNIKPLNSIERRIKSKVNKYKWGGTLIVAICRYADFGADIDDIKEVLYGTTSYFVDPISKCTIEKTNQDGLFTKKVAGNFQFTPLSGILYYELKWSKQPSILKQHT